MKTLAVVLALMGSTFVAQSAHATSWWWDWNSMASCYDYYETTTTTLKGTKGPEGYSRRIRGVDCFYVFGFPVN